VIRSFVGYVMVGAAGTAVQYGVLLVLVEACRFSPTLATTLGFLCGALVNYFLNFRFTFRSVQPHRRALPRFLTVAAIGLALNSGIVALGVDVLRLYYMIPQVVATGTVVIATFYLNRIWTF
jgi:putative flippase GtrA